MKTLLAEVIEGTHWTEEQTVRRFGAYNKQNEGKKWWNFFLGKTDVKQVAPNYADPAQFIEFIERVSSPLFRMVL